MIKMQWRNYKDLRKVEKKHHCSVFNEVQRHGNNLIRKCFPIKKVLVHLNTLEDIIPYVTVLGRTKYRIMLPVHLSDIQALKEKDPNIWQFYLDECFSVLVNCIPGTAEDVDHAGQREKKKLKIQVRLVGITRPENSMNKLFLLSHVFSEIENKRREMYHSQNKTKNKKNKTKN